MQVYRCILYDKKIGEDFCTGVNDCKCKLYDEILVRTFEYLLFDILGCKKVSIQKTSCAKLA